MQLPKCYEWFKAPFLESEKLINLSSTSENKDVSRSSES